MFSVSHKNVCVSLRSSKFFTLFVVCIVYNHVNIYTNILLYHKLAVVSSLNCCWHIALFLGTLPPRKQSVIVQPGLHALLPCIKCKLYFARPRSHNVHFSSNSYIFHQILTSVHKGLCVYVLCDYVFMIYDHMRKHV